VPQRAPVHRKPTSGARQHQLPEVDRQTTRALHTGSKAWQLQRARVLLRDRYCCRTCGRFGDQVDHINGDASQHVEDDALQTLCRKHHSEKTAREQGGFGNRGRSPR